MKYTLLPFFFSAATLCAGPDEFVNFVRQTEFDTFVQWDVPVARSGSMTSPQVLGELGSLYELVSVDATSGEGIALDREFISEYSPTVSLSFETGDPYSVVARTRVDQPVTLRVKIEGASSTSTLTTAAAYDRLNIRHEGFLYPDGVLSPYELGDTPTQFSNDYSLRTSGELVMEFPSATLAATNSTQTEGIEMFQVEPAINNNGHGNNVDDVDVSNEGTGNADWFDASGTVDDETTAGGQYIKASVLERATLQVWPVAEAILSGLDSGVLYEDVPPISVALTDLYPDSRTYIRVYEGGPTANPSNPIVIGSTAAIINDVIPQDRIMVVEDLDEYLTKSGTYTVEVLHETPFGTDVLTQFSPLNVEWKIEFRGTLYSRK